MGTIPKTFGLLSLSPHLSSMPLLQRQPKTVSESLSLFQPFSQPAPNSDFFLTSLILFSALCKNSPVFAKQAAHQNGQKSICDTHVMLHGLRGIECDSGLSFSARSLRDAGAVRQKSPQLSTLLRTPSSPMHSAALLSLHQRACIHLESPGPSLPAKGKVCQCAVKDACAWPCPT